MRISARLRSEPSWSFVNHVPRLAKKSVRLTTIGASMVLRPQTHSPATCPVHSWSQERTRIHHA
jgi:hypothetical protein